MHKPHIHIRTRMYWMWHLKEHLHHIGIVECALTTTTIENGGKNESI